MTDQFGCSGMSSPLGWVNVEEPSGQLKIEAFPNPVSEYLTVQIPSTLIGAEGVIYDIAGRELYRSKLMSISTIVDMSSFSGGSYLLRVGDLNVKVVKENG